jgi:hypothetical protein
MCGAVAEQTRSARNESLIEDATRAYEAWMGRFTPIVRADLALKHEHMRSDAFRFLRATFYRWQQRWPAVCHADFHAPVVLAVADLHIENFGTWRDQEGRLIWGVNDFDEAGRLPYTNDLIRLATSAFLAIEATHLRLAPTEAAEAILGGYTEALRSGGLPLVLEGNHPGLREMALSALRDPGAFWEHMRSGRRLTGTLPRGARKALEVLLPKSIGTYEVRRRVAGVGSLGRPRLVAVAQWQGGWIAREAKARVPSACVWSGALETRAYRDILKRAVRVRDPYLQIRRRWIVRRLAPDCGRIELANLPKARDEHRLLHAMGKDTANVHLGSAPARRILNDLGKRPTRWLETSARMMAEETIRDWDRWRHHSEH